MSSLKDWLAPRRTALLLVDCQVDFALPTGLMARQGNDVTEALVALSNAELLTEAARRAGVPCLFARLITRPAQQTATVLEWKLRRGHDKDPLLCREGSDGADFAGPRPCTGEAVFSKERYNAFAGTGLDARLRALGRDTLVIAGLTTECCVDSTARDAFERDYHVFIASDAVAAYQSELHRGALEALELNCAMLAASAEIIAAWR
jgi:nicotinamidase-related amidase